MFDIDITTTTGREHANHLRQKLHEAHDLLRPPLRELSLALVGDATMSRLHRQFMGIDGPTDVLSFPLEHDGRGRVIGGEVIVCVPHARRHRAQNTDDALRRELLLYALHGMLHLCGHDDKTEKSYRIMHQTEDDILTRLGIGPVFDPAADRRPVHGGTRRKRGGNKR